MSITRSFGCRRFASRRSRGASRLRVVVGPRGVLVQLAVQAGTDVFGRAQLAGMAQVLVAGGVGVAVEDADRDRLVERGDLAGPVDVDRVVLALVAIGARQA